jgi:hypothetical protein
MLSPAPASTVETFLAVVFLLALAAPPTFGANDEATDPPLEIFGWVERVELLDGKFSLKAKLDTGAATSSLDATDIMRFRRDGKRWVRFTLNNSETHQEMTLEKPLVRRVRIVRHSGRPQPRAVVKLPLCFGPFIEDVEFTLINRSNFIYPVLLGRSAMAGRALVDPGQTFLNAPDCETPGSNE